MSVQSELFSILASVDSSNNYAMGQVRAGLARHGEAWFALDQFGGRGQRSKSWISRPGENLILSLTVRPGAVFREKPFLLSMITANVCRELFAEYAGDEIKVKWPNDIYWRDRKTAGLLIENIYKGSDWDFAVIGIGMNINQTDFDESAGNPGSMKLITKKDHDPVKLAKQLQERLVKRIDEADDTSIKEIVVSYNDHLYKKNETVKLKKDNAVFETKIIAVNVFGQLMTEDVMERHFEFGEVSWER